MFRSVRKGLGGSDSLEETETKWFLESLLEDRIQKRIVELVLKNEPKEVIVETLVKELVKLDAD